jgi:hypothetical protein
VPVETGVDAAGRQPVELSLAQLAELRGITPVTEVRSQDGDAEFLEAIAQRCVDERVGRSPKRVQAIEPVAADPVRCDSFR